MTKHFSYYIVILLAIFMIGCNQPKEKATFFGGKIINPKTDYVLLYQREKMIDSFQLNSNNQFIGKLDSIKSGLYYFKHGQEYQFVYFEPYDSILIRLNTLDFDRSLVFSGKGSSRNNILIDSYLDGLKNDKKIYQFFSLTPNEFKEKIDSLEKSNLEKYTNFIADNKETESFKKFLKITLTYPLYSAVESYPLKNKMGANSAKFPSTDSNFYSHRKNTSVNNDTLIYYYPYKNYVVNYLYNLAYTKTNTNNKKFTINLLETIDAELNSVETKNILLRNTFLDYFFRWQKKRVNDDVFKTYLKLTTSNKDKKQIESLLEDLKQIKEKAPFTDFDIKDLNGKETSINKVIKNKNTALYFWNAQSVSKQYVASRVNYFINKFPKINFVGIQIDGFPNNRIEKLDIKNQFFIDSLSKANTFLNSKLPRTILINKKGYVVSSYTTLSSRKFKQQLNALSKN